MFSGFILSNIIFIPYFIIFILSKQLNHFYWIPFFSFCTNKLYNYIYIIIIKVVFICVVYCGALLNFKDYV